MELVGPRGTLRPWRRGDEDALVRHANNRNVWRNLTDRFPYPYTATDARAWVRQCSTADGPPRHLAITLDGEHRSFVSDLAGDSSADGVLQAILALAAALRMRTVAEGIETVAQYRLLASRGCREGQGYLFSRPLEAGAFSTLLATRSLPSASELLAEAG